jgi:hypothetical protein
MGEQNSQTEGRTNVEISASLTDTIVILRELVAAHKASTQRSRGRSLLVTKLEEAEMWAVKASGEEA